MKLEAFFGSCRALALAIGSLVLLAAPLFHAQETKEKITVDDADRTFLVRLPAGL